MRPKLKVAVPDPARFAHLFSVLSKWLNVEIVTQRSSNSRSDDGNWFDARITFCRIPAEVQSALSTSGRDRLILFADEKARLRSTSVKFSASPQLPIALRRQQLEQSVESSLPDICIGEVLAHAGEPIWTSVREHDRSTEFAVEALPELQPDQLLFDHLQLPKWTGLIPLITFLRRITRDTQWIAPPLRACVMIDDPNLHWSSYGYVKYATLARQAKKQGYHMAFATIPLDAWLIHPSTAALFRENSAQLSLLIHGNNHTRNELARSYTNRTRQALIAQSLKRIEHLERTARLQVPKIMAAPHSAFSEEFASELLRQGYEAVCVSFELLRRFNSRTWPVCFGLEPASFLAGGLPVIPRFSVGNGCRKAALLAAFLNQPVIPFGHHEDLAGDPSAVSEAIAYISTLGPVKWCDLAQIARTNYSYRLSSKSLQLRMYSRHIEVSVLPEIQTVSVARPWLESDDGAEILEMRMGAENWQRVSEAEVTLPTNREGAARRVEFRSISQLPTDYHQMPSQPLQAWAIVRRMLTEVRDRCYGSGG
jgi:hypothetical protein